MLESTTLMFLPGSTQNLIQVSADRDDIIENEEAVDLSLQSSFIEGNAPVLTVNILDRDSESVMHCITNSQ